MCKCQKIFHLKTCRLIWSSWIILARARCRHLKFQEGKIQGHEFKASFGHWVNLRLAWASKFKASLSYTRPCLSPSILYLPDFVPIQSPSKKLEQSAALRYWASRWAGWQTWRWPGMTASAGRCLPLYGVVFQGWWFWTRSILCLCLSALCLWIQAAHCIKSCTRS